MKKEQHIFALYDERLSFNTKARSYTITDSDMVHRISRVLRLEINDEIIFFNQSVYAPAIVSAIARDSVTLQLQATQSVAPLQPKITFLLPLLKKDALSNAVYGLIEAGASEIQLVTTAKTQRAWGSQNELERLNRIAIAAAEQSKHFAFPTIKAPIALQAAIADLSPSSQRYYGNPDGQSFALIAPLAAKAQEIALLVGPEGDLTNDEKQLVVANGFKPVALTPTILRAESAAFCMVSLFRTAL
jgi:16S rRNA (uracil1498-N3)-methyltransferase